MTKQHSISEIKQAFANVDLSSRGSNEEYARVTASEAETSTVRERARAAIAASVDGLSASQLRARADEALKRLAEIPAPPSPLTLEMVEALTLLADGCPRHPSYRAKRHINTLCERCNAMWEARQKLVRLQQNGGEEQ